MFYLKQILRLKWNPIFPLSPSGGKCSQYYNKSKGGSSYCGSAVRNTTSIHEDTAHVSISGLAQWVKVPALPWVVVWVTNEAWIWCCCGCGRLAAAAPIQPLAWEFQCAVGVAFKKKKKQEQRGISLTSVLLVKTKNKLIQTRGKTYIFKSELNNIERNTYFILSTWLWSNFRIFHLRKYN